MGMRPYQPRRRSWTASHRSDRCRQQADVIGVELEFRYTDRPFNLIVWRGHRIHFSLPENVGNRYVALRVTGYYQIDEPEFDYGGTQN